jgi:acetylornithine deacetylase/succinyl-diaminopimelate desuccinylase-like protein
MASPQKGAHSLLKREFSCRADLGASDARYFARDGIELLVTGPGDGADSHIANEFVRLEEVVQAASIQLEALKRIGV